MSQSKVVKILQITYFLSCQQRLNSNSYSFTEVKKNELISAWSIQPPV